MLLTACGAAFEAYLFHFETMSERKLFKSIKNKLYCKNRVKTALCTGEQNDIRDKQLHRISSGSEAHGKNTEVSYHRDLLQMAGFMEEMGITQVEKVTKTSLNSYILYLEKEGKAAATISRNWRPSRHFSAILLRKER